MNYITTTLSSVHNRSLFYCGKEMLDNYIQKQAKQDVKNKVAACFVLATDNGEIQGYFTLSNGSINRDHLPASILKKLPRYKDLPVTLLGRLAIDKKFQGRKLGEQILMDALKRSLDASKTLGSLAVVVDPIDKEAEDFYVRYGFIMLPDSGRMFLPMSTIEMAFQ